jgi:phosphoglycolate phosphatase
MPPSQILFDLDGTLTDSAPGIVASLQHALAAFGVSSPEPQELRELIGPPIQESLRALCGGDAAVGERAMLAYRQHYVEKGMFESSLYPGVVELLASLHESGAVLALATSKPTVFAQEILVRFSVRPYFAAVCGADLAGQRSGKTEIVADALGSLPVRGPGGAVMVGDREYDVHGAKANGIACIGAGWGYGGPGELARAGASSVVRELRDVLASW